MDATPGIEQPQAGSEEVMECNHFSSNTRFITPCCNKLYCCKYCHDNEEDHSVDEKDITEVVCTPCKTRQVIQPMCNHCGVVFGNYTCVICKLFNDIDVGQFHCDGCGICRVGGKDNFFHCGKCNICLPILLKDNHKCVENVSRGNCPVCLEDIHTSLIPSRIPDCGHLLHKTCYSELLNAGHFSCPICQHSYTDMTEMWKYLDNEVASNPMPRRFRFKRLDILCKDCHEHSTVSYHTVGLKCIPCGSYNTCVTHISDGGNSSSSTSNADVAERTVTSGEDN